MVRNAIRDGAEPASLLSQLMRHFETVTPNQLGGMAAWSMIKLVLRDNPELATGEWE